MDETGGPAFTTETPRRRLRAVVLSVACHGAVLAYAVLTGWAYKATVPRTISFERLDKVEIAGASHRIQIKLPDAKYTAHTREPVPNAEALAKTKLPIPKTHPPDKSGGGSTASPHKGDGAGQALAGNGSDSRDVRPAFPIFSPRPPVSDRSLLPSSEQKIVIEVNVDALGQVVSENLVKGMGTRLDQIVLDVVKTWRFQPATVDGKPVPTEAELVFPFNPSYPISDS